MAMIQRKFYFPEELYERLQLQAKIERKRITDVLRELVDQGLEEKKEQTKREKKHPLLQLAELGKKYSFKGPKDFAENHDKYFAEAWEELKGKRIRNQK